MMNFFKVHCIAGSAALLTAILPCEATAVAADITLSDTVDGPVKGVLHQDHVEFLGIPYAKPPVGELRWKPPGAPARREQVLSATSFAAKCTQLESEKVIGSEDCLYLNVYRPKSDSAKSLPVLFYIHGGALTQGAGQDVDGAVLAAENDSVVVTINYRLNGFGFFAHPATVKTSDLTANYGLLDQRLAMKWVQENIRSFGGDPANVTIYGYSSGAISVFAHLASPGSWPFFHKAVALSGGWYPKGRTLEQAETSGVKDAESWGCKGDEMAVRNCLHSQPADRIVKASTPPGEYEFVPLVDKVVLPMSPEAALKSGAYSKVPFITGATQNEYSRYMYGDGPKSKANFAEDASKYLSPYADRVIPPAEIAAEYDTSKFENPTQAYAATATDFMIACQHLKMADDMIRHDPRVWAYQFGFQDNPPPTFDVPEWYGNIGNYHAVDMRYWFGTFTQPPLGDLKTLSSRMRAYLTNFARNGDPNGAGLPTWKTLADNPDKVLNFAKPLDPNWDAKSEHHCGFWSRFDLQL